MALCGNNTATTQSRLQRVTLYLKEQTTSPEVGEALMGAGCAEPELGLSAVCPCLWSEGFTAILSSRLRNLTLERTHKVW